MTRSPTRVAALLALLAAGCGPKGPAAAVQQAPPPPSVADLTLGPGDVFDVRVFGEPELTGTWRVGADGMIDYPLAGQVHVDGKSAIEVGREIARRLGDGYVRNPQVSVLVKEYLSKKVSVFGQVQKPGTFGFVQNMTVVEAISLAGGFTAMAAKDDALLTRVEGKRLVRTKIPVKRIAEGGAANVFLRPGDVLFVPERIF